MNPTPHIWANFWSTGTQSHSFYLIQGMKWTYWIYVPKSQVDATGPKSVLLSVWEKPVPSTHLRQNNYGPFDLCMDLKTSLPYCT